MKEALSYESRINAGAKKTRVGARMIHITRGQAVGRRGEGVPADQTGGRLGHGHGVRGASAGKVLRGRQSRHRRSTREATQAAQRGVRREARGRAERDRQRRQNPGSRAADVARVAPDRIGPPGSTCRMGELMSIRGVILWSSLVTRNTTAASALRRSARAERCAWVQLDTPTQGSRRWPPAARYGLRTRSTCSPVAEV